MQRLNSDPTSSSTTTTTTTAAAVAAVRVRSSVLEDDAAAPALTSPTNPFRSHSGGGGGSGGSCSSASSHGIRHSLGFRNVHHSSLSDTSDPSARATTIASGTTNTSGVYPRKGPRSFFEKFFRLHRKRASPPPSYPHPSGNGNDSHSHGSSFPMRQRSEDGGAPRVVMEGMLTILSAHHKYWQKKPNFFQLVSMGSKSTLFHYRERGESRPLSEFRLSKYDKVSDITDSCHNTTKPVLELNCRDRFRPLRLLATDRQTLQNWLEAIALAIKQCGHPNLPSSAERFVARESLPNRMAAMEVSSDDGSSKSCGSATGVDAHKCEERRLPESESKSLAVCGHCHIICRCDSRDSKTEEATSSAAPGAQCPSVERRSSGSLNHSTKSSNSNSNNNNYEDDDEDNQHYELRGSLSASLSPDENLARFISSPNEQPRDSTNDNQSSSEAKPWTSGSATSSAAGDGVERSSASSSGVSSGMDRSSVGNKLRVGYPTTSASARTNVHSFNANGQIFTLDVRYRLIKSIGTGAYGAVIAAKDSRVDQSVAIKKITNIFDDLVDAKRILREVRLLHHFHHKNITKLLDLPPPLSKRNFEDMYIITELMETDLHQVIYSMQPMSDDHIKYFLYQTLCALHHIHSAGVLHRDIKPSNILLNSNCDLKICDFGLARGGVPETLELTEYVATRWYRAPEIMLNCLNYTAAVDVWAVGCIFAEMILREPLFPGNDYIHQLKLIIRFLGTPKQEDIEFVKNNKALRFLTRLPISKPKKFQEHFADTNELALNLLQKMLVFNPAKRISVWDALHHPYLASFYEAKDISGCLKFDFTFDLPDDKLTKDALMDLLLQDIEQFHPNQKLSMVHPTTSYRAATAAGGTTATNAVGSAASAIHRPFGVSASAS